MTATVTSKKDVFQFHTNCVSEDAGNEQNVTDCPFCGKEKHFYYNPLPDKLLWDCKSCQRKGNKYTFLSLLYEQQCQIVFEVPLKGIPYKHYATAGVRKNPFNDTLVLPTYNNEGALNNLYKYVEHSNRWMGSPTCAHGLLGNKEVLNDDVWICEGHFDYLAAIAMIGVTRPISPVGVPGAGVFKDDWLYKLKDKNITILADNDDAGLAMVDKIIEIIKASPVKPKSIKSVSWEGKGKGYDLRDFYNEEGRKAFKALATYTEEIKDNTLVKVTVQNVIEDFSCDSYDKAIEACKKAFVVTSDMELVIPAVMASIYSVNVKGEQVWFRIIGAPSSGKTSIAKAVSASDQVVSRSTFTGLFSGWSDDKDDDPGLIPQIAGKTLIVKDADALLRQPNIERIMSELRDFFDKSSTVQYRNRKSYDYQNIRSTFILMGTNVLRRADHSYLGERFLTLEMNTTSQEEEAINKFAFKAAYAQATGKEEEPDQQLMSSMKGWINHLMQLKIEDEPDSELENEIINMAWIAAKLRTQVDRNMRGDIASPPVPELPPRLIKQMVSTAMSLCVVFQIPKPNELVYKILSKITRDIVNCKSPRYQICDFLLENPNQSRESIVECLGLSRSVVTRELDDLRVLNFIQESKVSTGNRPGAKMRAFALDKTIKDGLLCLR